MTHSHYWCFVFYLLSKNDTFRSIWVLIARRFQMQLETIRHASWTCVVCVVCVFSGPHIYNGNSSWFNLVPKGTDTDLLSSHHTHKHTHYDLLPTYALIHICFLLDVPWIKIQKWDKLDIKQQHKYFLLFGATRHITHLTHTMGILHFGVKLSYYIIRNVFNH